MSAAAEPDRRGFAEGGEIAAVDLGSNSFHLAVAQAGSGGLRLLDRLREAVRLGGGLDGRGRLDPATADRALACLRRFGERIAQLPASQVRAVGTSALRRLRDGGRFLRMAAEALGHEIEVISGAEEARLVYLAVARGHPELPPRRLVVDIGGGSTELIVGSGEALALAESVELGCVSHTRAHFPDGRITRKRFDRALAAACSELEFLQQRYRTQGWDVAVGTSGTIRGIWRVLGQVTITRAGIDRIVDELVGAGHIDRIRYPALREDRRPVFAGGLAILAAVFEVLGVAAMQTSDQALREGLLHDLVGRLRHRDGREGALLALAQRFGVDLAQARAVAATARALLDQVATEWQLTDADARQWLGWAALVHEIGLAVSHAGYHRHGEYILQHADLPGFSRTEQGQLAALVRLHRRRFATELLSALEGPQRARLARLAVLLRLACLLHRARRAPDALPSLTADGPRLVVRLPEAVRAQRPLLMADLADEARRLRRAGFRLQAG